MNLFINREFVKLDLQTLIFTTRTMFSKSILVAILEHATLYSDRNV